ncbi:MAG: LemA family protein [Candidatus Moranbacteria bacterium]|nr:LemA family protein [Candidatus Moranbacteria bacterium]NTW46007.1 LemA family protein [Candidatus Moranbacteria bacterium]
MNMPILLVVIVAVAAWAAIAYNRLVTLKNRTDESWSDIDVQLKRRYDLIPNLVNTVKGYAAHESGVFEKVTEARTRAMAAGDAHAKMEAENALSGTLKSLFAVAENYPELKANENFLELQRELSDTENKIQSARRFYNANVRDLDTMIESFPTNIAASMFSFRKRDFFELEEEAAKKPVEVSF